MMNHDDTIDLSEIEKILKPNEKISGYTKPVLIPYALHNFSSGIISLLFMIMWLYFAYNVQHDNKETFSFLTSIGWAMILFSIEEKIRYIITGRKTIYALTNERIIIQTTFVKRTILSIYIKKIVEIDLQQKYINKKYEVGTIRIFTGNTYQDDGDTIKKYNYLIAIPNAEELYNAIKNQMN